MGNKIIGKKEFDFGLTLLLDDEENDIICIFKEGSTNSYFNSIYFEYNPNCILQLNEVEKQYIGEKISFNKNEYDFSFINGLFYMVSESLKNGKTLYDCLHEIQLIFSEVLIKDNSNTVGVIGELLFMYDTVNKFSNFPFHMEQKSSKTFDFISFSGVNLEVKSSQKFSNIFSFTSKQLKKTKKVKLLCAVKVEILSNYTIEESFKTKFIVDKILSKLNVSQKSKFYEIYGKYITNESFLDVGIQKDFEVKYYDFPDLSDFLQNIPSFVIDFKMSIVPTNEINEDEYMKKVVSAA